ncbi:hypothetical protein J8TS2_13090 [Lederbergia ruris]|uniref:Transposase n=1 Tax=Lederbergia ruris TaxID=217495 RepID=A0ABQ4KG85_9BACI|nr:hypothetical protein [Lederbergia ruris]GIN56990.1 hypothetical protein J8TS2_13090 [Lederbergia ruris]
MERTMHPVPPTLKPFIDEWREEGKKLGIAKGKAEGKAEGKKEIAMAMLKKGFSFKEIMEFTNLTEKELEDLKDQV